MGDRRRRRAARARFGARRGPARRSVHEPHQHPHHGARGDARPRTSSRIRSSTIISSARGRERRAASRCSTQLLGMGQSVLTLASLSVGARGAQPVAARCCSSSPSCRASSARRTSRRCRIRCSSAGRRSGDSWTTCGSSARATRRRRKSRCSGSAPWLIARYTRSLSNVLRGESRALRSGRRFVSSALSLIGTLGYYGAYVVDPGARRRRRDHASAR